jgi:T5SS/PEP-CTERM-associated repeat protein
MIRAKGVARAVVAATMLIAACAGAAEGATDSWIKSAGGTFADSSNWSLAAPPAPADDAVFNLHSAGYTVTFGGTCSNAGLTVSDDAVTFDFKSYKYTLTRPSASVNIGTAPNDTGSLTLMNGTLASGDGTLGANSPSTSGTVVVPGGAAWEITNNLFIGFPGKGTVAVQSGGMMTAGYAGVGYLPGSVGALSVDGIGTIGSVGGSIVVGYQGSGTLSVTRGGRFSSLLAAIGNDPSAVGSAIVDGAGSAWSAGGGPFIVAYRGRGSLAITNGGQVVSPSGSTVASDVPGIASVRVEGTGSAWTNTTLDIAAAGTATMLIQDAGYVSDSTGTVGGAKGASGTVIVTGGGALWYNTDALYVGGKSAGAGGSGSLTVGAGGTVRVGTKSLKLWGPGTLTMAGGTVQAPGLENIGLVRGTGNIIASLVNNAEGEVRAAAGEELVFSGDKNDNSGRISLADGSVRFIAGLANLSPGFITGRGTLSFGGPGLLNVGNIGFSGGFTDVYGDVHNAASAKIIVSGGGTTTFYDDMDNTGEIRVSAGCAAVFFGSLNSGTTGTGTVYMEGDLTPGRSPAAVLFEGDLVLGTAARLVAELGGTQPGSQYDTVGFGGRAALAGTLDVDLLGGFQPQAGQTFDILDFDPGDLSGRFSAFDLPDLGGGLSWDTSNLYTTGTITVIPEPTTLALLALGGALALLRRRSASA